MRYEAQCWVIARQDEMPDEYKVFTVEADSKEEAIAQAKQHEKRAYDITVVPLETIEND